MWEGLLWQRMRAIHRKLVNCLKAHISNKASTRYDGWMILPNLLKKWFVKDGKQTIYLKQWIDEMAVRK